MATTIQYEDMCNGFFFLPTNPISGEECADLSGNHGTFVGYYDPDANDTLGLRDGVARAWAYELDADWNGLDQTQTGNLIVSYNHMWSKYTADWEIGWDISWNGEPGIGFTLKPRVEENEKDSFLGVRYCFGNYTSC